MLNLIFNTIRATCELRIVNGYLDSIENSPWQVPVNSEVFFFWIINTNVAVLEKNEY